MLGADVGGEVQVREVGEVDKYCSISGNLAEKS